MGNGFSKKKKKQKERYIKLIALLTLKWYNNVRGITESQYNEDFTIFEDRDRRLRKHKHKHSLEPDPSIPFEEWIYLMMKRSKIDLLKFNFRDRTNILAKYDIIIRIAHNALDKKYPENNKPFGYLERLLKIAYYIHPRMDMRSVRRMALLLDHIKVHQDYHTELTIMVGEITLIETIARSFLQLDKQLTNPLYTTTQEGTPITLVSPIKSI
jgi:hypothetical protein